MKDKELGCYNFSMVPFWIRKFNVPMELIDRKLALEVGGSSRGGHCDRLEGQGWLLDRVYENKGRARHFEASM